MPTARRKRKSSAYAEGVQARQGKKGPVECPYPPTTGTSGDRANWWSGYYDEEIRLSLGHILKEWPEPTFYDLPGGW